MFNAQAHTILVDGPFWTHVGKVSIGFRHISGVGFRVCSSLPEPISGCSLEKRTNLCLHPHELHVSKVKSLVLAIARESSTLVFGGA